MDDVPLASWGLLCVLAPSVLSSIVSYSRDYKSLHKMHFPALNLVRMRSQRSLNGGNCGLLRTSYFRKEVFCRCKGENNEEENENETQIDEDIKFYISLNEDFLKSIEAVKPSDLAQRGESFTLKPTNIEPNGSVPLRYSIDTGKETIKIPSIIFGTRNLRNWTEEAVVEALRSGMRGIDSANWPPYYREDLVSKALGRAEPNKELSSVAIQTRFVMPEVYDNPPYSVRAQPADWVKDSFMSSDSYLRLKANALRNAAEDFGSIDVLLLDLSEADDLRSSDETQQDRILSSEIAEVWATMESLVKENRVKVLGVASSGELPLRIINSLISTAEIPPKVVQSGNCLAENGWDIASRKFCKSRGILYQATSLVRFNSYLLEDKDIINIAMRHGKTPDQVLLRFAMQSEIIPVVTSPLPVRIKQILGVYELDLSSSEVTRIATISKLYDYE